MINGISLVIVIALFLLVVFFCHKFSQPKNFKDILFKSADVPLWKVLEIKEDKVINGQTVKVASLQATQTLLFSERRPLSVYFSPEDTDINLPWGKMYAFEALIKSGLDGESYEILPCVI